MMSFVPFRNGQRLTLVAFVLLSLACSACSALVAVVWRGIFPHPLPIAIALIFTVLPFLVWIAPMPIWIYRAATNGGYLHTSELPASAAIVFTWGLALAGISRLSPGAHLTVVDSIAIPLLTGIFAVWFSRFIDRSTLLAVAVGTGAGAGAVFAALRADAAIRNGIHVLHTHHFLSAISSNAVPWITIPSAIAIGVGSIELLSRTLLPRSETSTSYTSIARVSRSTRLPIYTTTVQTGFERQASRPGLDQHRRDEYGKRAERELFALLEPMQNYGWQLTKNMFLDRDRIGDVDALMTAPSGRRYAIDAKSRLGCDVVFDASTEDLTIVKRDGSREQTGYLQRAPYQTRVLGERGFGTVQPVLCFFGANIYCDRRIRDVVILTPETIRSWLNDDAAASTAASADCAPNS